MKAKISKAQIEVWEWKERALKKMEEIPLNERVKYIYSRTDNMISRLKKLKELANG